MQVFKSLADESRVRILHLLYKYKELSISDLELILDFTQTKVSRHMTYLKNAGIVNSIKKDQWVFYIIREEVYDIISQIFTFLNKDQQLLQDEKTYETLYSNRELATRKIELKKYRS